MAKGLEGLEVWQASVAFVGRVYRELLPALPKEKKWAMSAQLRRAAQSIPANIAEGYGRHYFQEGVRFCYIARGSAEEVYTYLTLARKVAFISGELADSLIADLNRTQKLINGYSSFLKRSKQGEGEPGSGYQLRETEAAYEADLIDGLTD